MHHAGVLARLTLLAQQVWPSFSMNQAQPPASWSSPNFLSSWVCRPPFPSPNAAGSPLALEPSLLAQSHFPRFICLFLILFMFWGVPASITEKPSGKSQPGAPVYLVKVLDENLHHDVLELNIHHCCNRVLLCTHEGGAKDHPHVGGGHEILPAVLTHTVRRRRKNRGGFSKGKGTRDREQADGELHGP